jgi:hypothetical protein
MSLSNLTNVLQAKCAAPSSEIDQATPSRSPSPVEHKTWEDDKASANRLYPDRPDWIELFKRIVKTDGEGAQIEVNYSAGNRGMLEYTLSRQAYRKVDMKFGHDTSAHSEFVAYESGQMEQFTILSSHLRSSFQEVVGFYPVVDLSEPRLVFHRPFSLLFLLLPSLKGLWEKIGPDDCRYGDLRVLLFLCETHLSEPFSLIRTTLDCGLVTFQTLEILFRPGVKLLAKDVFGQWQSTMCIAGTFARDVHKQGQYCFSVNAWHLAWNSVSKQFERRLILFCIRAFAGTKRIDTLSVFPLSDFENQSARDVLISSLVQRGHR